MNNNKFAINIQY